MSECPCPFCSGHFEFPDPPPRMKEKREELKLSSYLESIMDPLPPIPWDYPEDEGDK